MPDRKLNAKQRAVMLVLMAEGRELSNTEMDELYGLRLTGQDREQLDDQDLVTSGRSGNGPFVLGLTDSGWGWCADELTAGRPNASRQESLGKALYAVLAGLGRYLEDVERGLADVFSCVPDESVEDRIRAIYRKLAERPGDYVSLTDLRQELNGVSRAETDKALLNLNQEEGVTLAPEEDQKLLAEHDRAAALHLGTQDIHLLAIESS
ncbi:hypothetical protein [Amycolatopsis speibonae]|uniref:WYL domain-containing protein n=1 Tax=Amycolatopsis speibonae TaxID=1450224 RepID=A0ABV7NYR0_9PSEU